ncbi:hypothetical protein [Fontivita pretiosa]|uniref:hypothetical protein n=1 Tax=Fontivita pretiosa TaxID=2989684 RepID=UPI003D173960
MKRAGDRGPRQGQPAAGGECPDMADQTTGGSAAAAVADAPPASGVDKDSTTVSGRGDLSSGSNDRNTASHPSPQRSSAGDKAANTAPAASLHREAFERLVKGERPDAVNKALFAPKQQPSSARPMQRRDAADGSTAQTQAHESADDAAKPQPAKSDRGQSQSQSLAWKFGYPDGTSDADVQVLKRAHMDPETWEAIPPSNRVKILKGLKETQAHADREETRRRQQAGKGGDGKPGKAAAAGTTQTPPDKEVSTAPYGRGDLGQDAATSGGGEGDQVIEIDADGVRPAGSTARLTADKSQHPGGQPPAEDAAASMADQVASFIDPKDLETLQLVGGDEFAQTLTRTTQRVVSHFARREAQQQEQIGQLLSVGEFLLSEYVENQFNRGLDLLEQLPGLENIRDESRQKEREALRKKADLLHRAAGDPRSYSYVEAMQDAAASLFKTNIHQTAQARLLTARTQSLRGTPAALQQRRGGQARPLTTRERNAAIFAELQRGATPEEARAIVDGR